MTNFITNLARRSAGLAPVVAARVTPAAGVGDAGTPERAAAPRMPLPSAPRPAEPQAGSTPIHIYVDRGMSPAPTAASILPASVPAPPPAPKHAAPSESVVRETTRISTTTILVPATPVPARVLADSPAPLSPVRDLPGAAPEPPRVEPRVEHGEAREVLTELEPARDEAPPAVEAAQPRTRLESLREIVHRIEPRVEPEAVIVAPAPTTATAIQPALARDAEARAAEPHPAESRIVQVRIGAIEIHAAAPQAVSTPTPAAPSAAQRATPVGFDGFARLRSYAPWEW